jgi:hypothetical protein
MFILSFLTAILSVSGSIDFMIGIEVSSIGFMECSLELLSWFTSFLWLHPVYHHLKICLVQYTSLRYGYIYSFLHYFLWLGCVSNVLAFYSRIWFWRPWVHHFVSSCQGRTKTSLSQEKCMFGKVLSVNSPHSQVLILEIGISFILLGKGLLIAFNYFVPVLGDNFYIVTHFLYLILFELIPVVWLLWVYIDTTKIRTFGEVCSYF